MNFHKNIIQSNNNQNKNNYHLNYYLKITYKMQN